MSVQNMEIKREEYMKQVRMRAPKVQENHVTIHKPKEAK